MYPLCSTGRTSKYLEQWWQAYGTHAREGMPSQLAWGHKVPHAPCHTPPAAPLRHWAEVSTPVHTAHYRNSGHAQWAEGAPGPLCMPWVLDICGRNQPAYFHCVCLEFRACVVGTSMRAGTAAPLLAAVISLEFASPCDKGKHVTPLMIE